ncbi:unnamed protein product [Prunus armeniaca]|uniref:Uncharacterized protein n=1 Tax=Prunus armeniaca TaxID=36596 RepID=A0A6J5VCT4_PRUAR|nr:unnamed protein product [Prunus armeniaca]CAB4317178.1 unnamed protein product [Prunus armeniaca]
MARLKTLRMKESESVEEYFNHVISLFNQLRINGDKIEDQRVAEKILRSQNILLDEAPSWLENIHLDDILGIATPCMIPAAA